MQTLERALLEKGFGKVAGIDEAGRGPLAGPVVAAAVVLGPGKFQSEISDSKQLSPKKRLLAYEEILHTCSVAVGIASVEEIDRLNILQATLLAMGRAVRNLPIAPDFCLVDGPHAIPSLDVLQKPVVRGDRLSLSIAAASIVAKVKRDALMLDYHELYPQYNFGKNKGYATEEHRRAILANGRCPIHRSSFRCAGL